MATRIRGRRSNKTMEHYHKKVILEFLGIPPQDMPTQISILDIMLEQAKREDPDRYQQAYNIVVNKNAVEPETAEPGLVHLAQLTDILDEKIGEYEGEAIKKVQMTYDIEQQRIGELFTKSAFEVKQAAMKAALDGIEEATKKFIQVEYVVRREPNIVTKVKGPLPEQFQEILDLADERINILLVGPSGCGKTHISIEVAKSLGLDFASQSCSAGMSESIFAGWLLPIEAAGQFVYVSSEFVRIYENGGIFLFDEIDGSDSNTLLFLNQALANQEFYLPQRHKKPKVKKHKDFVAIAAANTYGTGATAMYNGRNALDAATLDRFRMGIVQMDYSKIVEEELIDSELLAWGRKIREVINRHRMRKIMSTRLLIDATKMKKGKKWDLSKIAKSYFSDWSPEEMKIIDKALCPF